MSFSQLTSGLITLIAIVAGFMIFKHWKNNAWADILSTVAIGGLLWALFSGKDIFSMAWDVIVAILGVFGIKLK
jgi:hypothetical protein